MGGSSFWKPGAVDFGMLEVALSAASLAAVMPLSAAPVADRWRDPDHLTGWGRSRGAPTKPKRKANRLHVSKRVRRKHRRAGK